MCVACKRGAHNNGVFGADLHWKLLAHQQMKRNRSASPARHYADDNIDTPEHNPKFQRVDTSSSNDSQLLWCSLGPGCAPPNEPSSFQTIEELEVHYTRCHAYVCNADGCNCVFEREFYLNLGSPSRFATLEKFTHYVQASIRDTRPSGAN
jgi:hypothetical protein